MAMTTHTRRSAWKKAYKKLSHLNHRLEQAVQPHDRDQLERAVAAQQEKVLDMSAPSFLAVLHKLEILWEGQVEGVDQESEFKRLILGDLSDLCAESAALVGYRSPFDRYPWE